MRKLIALFGLLVLSLPAFAQTVTLSVAPTSGAGSVVPVVTWSSTGVVSCTASGGWSGTKATSGTETLPAITKDATYNLTCTTAAGTTGSAVLNWTLPTLRTDGSALTNLAGFRIYHGTAASSLSTRVDVTSGTATTFTVPNLPTGVRFFAMTSVDAAGLESTRTGAVSTTVVGAAPQQIAATPVTVAVQSLPQPPSGLTVQAVIAGLDVSPVYRLLHDGTRSQEVAGFADVGATCGGRVLFRYRGRDYRPIPVDAVRVWNTPRTSTFAVACG